MRINSKNPSKELTTFMWASIICFVLAVFIVPFLAVAAIAFAARAGMLSFDKRIKGEYYIPRTRVVVGITIIGSLWALYPF